jgi:hypothetical protein
MSWNIPLLFAAAAAEAGTPTPLVPVSPILGALVVAGFVAAASAVLWWVGRLAEPAPATDPSPPAVRKAA